MQFFDAITTWCFVTVCLQGVASFSDHLNFKHWNMCTDAWEKSSAVCVTGATGVLGQQICRQLSTDGSFRVFATFRCHRSDIESMRGVSWFPLNVEQRLQHSLWDQAREGVLYSPDVPPRWSFDLFDDSKWKFFTPATKKVILVNCMAVSPAGRSVEAFQKAFIINSFLPLFLSGRLFAAAKEFASKSALEEVVIVNISSGDGEIVLLDGDVARWLQSTNCLRRLQTDAATWLLPTTQQPHRETAVGVTPAYSLSKAVLNRITHLLSKEKHTLPCSLRVISLCPGNFLSPLSTEEERYEQIEPIRPVQEAASDVISAILNDDGRFASGGFFRYGRAICF